MVWNSPAVVIQNIVKLILVWFCVNTGDDFVGFDKFIKQRIVFMNEEGIKDIGIAGTDNAFKLNNRAVIKRFKPVGKFMKTGLFAIVAVVANI